MWAATASWRSWRWGGTASAGSSAERRRLERGRARAVRPRPCLPSRSGIKGTGHRMEPASPRTQSPPLGAPEAARVPAEAPLAELRGVWKTYTAEGGRELTVLRDVTLAVLPGEIVVILGPSGCGKSTLLRLLTGLIPPSRGEVLCHGKRLTSIHPGAAIVFQSFALYPWLSVQQNVQVGLHGRGLPTAVERTRVRQAIDLVGLEGFEEAFPKELSGGMKQRVGIARALVGGPELLCMDEPFSALDVLTAESLRSEVYGLWTRGDLGLQGVLLHTHLIEEA